MKQISQEAFRKGIEPYELPYIKSCQIEYPFIKANFEIPHSIYLKQNIESGHLNAIDLLMCFNQMSFSGIYEFARLNSLPKFSKEFFERLEKNIISNSLMTRITKLDFIKPVNPKNFSIEMKIENLREGKLSLFQTSFNVENNIFGNINLAFIKTI